MVDINIFCGDYRKVIPNVNADLIFTSPPYNIGSKRKKVTGFRKLGLYDPKSFGAIRDYPDSLPENEYQRQQVEFLKWAAMRMKRDGVLVYNHKPRRRGGRIIHPYEWFVHVPELTMMEEIIWDRGSTHNHCDRLIWPHTERLYVFRRTDGEYTFQNTAELRFRSDVWRISKEVNNGHNSPFPLALAEAVICAWSKEGDLVVDPYCGSGTAAIAAKKLERNFIGSDILEKYYKMSLVRISDRKVA